MTTPDDARCRGCGYRLRGLSTPMCPECGRPGRFVRVMSSQEYDRLCPINIAPPPPTELVRVGLVLTELGG